MKKLLLFAAAIASASAHADDVALLSIEVGKDRTPGLVAIEFHEADAPRTVENFKKLAKKGFYKGLAFHRAFPHILVQTGDPKSKAKDRTNVGIGGPGYTLLPEIRRKHVKGAVVAARLPDKINPSRVSNGSQFFICLQPASNYDGQYTVFGQVLYGYDTLDAISTAAVDSNDYPVERSFIRSVKIVPREQLPPNRVPWRRQKSARSRGGKSSDKATVILSGVPSRAKVGRNGVEGSREPEPNARDPSTPLRMTPRWKIVFAFHLNTLRPLGGARIKRLLF